MPKKNRYIAPFDAPAVSQDDPHANTIAAHLVAIEQELGERQGWDSPAQLFTLQLLPEGEVQAVFYPASEWNRAGLSPARALCGLGTSLPAVPEVIEHADAAQAAHCAVGFMFKVRLHDPSATPSPGPADQSQPDGHEGILRPGLRQARFVYAVDLNQVHYQFLRPRGGQLDLNPSGMFRDTSPERSVPHAVARIMHALRIGHPVFPGQSA